MDQKKDQTTQTITTCLNNEVNTSLEGTIISSPEEYEDNIEKSNESTDCKDYSTIDSSDLEISDSGHTRGVFVAVGRWLKDRL